MKQDLLRSYEQLLIDSPHGLLGPADRARAGDHIDDALQGARALAALSPTSFVDVGTGAGLPGVVIAIELGIGGHLVESDRTKAAFVQQCVERLGIADRVAVHPERAETVAGQLPRESIDLACCRALAHPISATEYLAPFVRLGGHAALWSTQSRFDDSGLANVVGQFGFAAPVMQPLPSRLREAGCLIVMEKVDETPQRFPRRVGVAHRRPLTP